MKLVVPPGVFRPIGDTWLLADALDREPLRPGARVLDLCSGRREEDVVVFRARFAA